MRPPCRRVAGDATLFRTARGKQTLSPDPMSGPGSSPGGSGPAKRWAALCLSLSP